MRGPAASHRLNRIVTTATVAEAVKLVAEVAAVVVVVGVGVGVGGGGGADDDGNTTTGIALEE